MYPTIYDAFLDLFGWDIPFLKIVMTFGFFVALGFIAANWAMISELKRKEAEGVIQAIQKPKAKPNANSEYLSSGLIGFILGWKVVYLFLNFSSLADNPQAFLLSREGSLLWGVILAGVSIAFKYYQLKNRPAFKEGDTYTFHPYQMMGNVTMIAAVTGFLGAKIFHHLENWGEFIQDPIGALAEPFSGLTFFGGLICGAAAVLWYANKQGVKWRVMLDVGGPAMMLAYGVGRMGCHFSGDGDWGTENLADKPNWLSWLPDWAWSYSYPNNVLGITLENPVWPTPLYEIIMAFILFAILWSMRKRIKVAGVLFSIYLIFSGIERYIIEKIRVNPDYHFAGLNFTQAEMISVFFVLLGTAGIIWFKKLEKN
ncbi:MAG: prolipoprotein diacylglyceryl transferase [Bacteroidia bacterium]